MASLTWPLQWGTPVPSPWSLRRRAPCSWSTLSMDSSLVNTVWPRGLVYSYVVSHFLNVDKYNNLESWTTITMLNFWSYKKYVTLTLWPLKFNIRNKYKTTWKVFQNFASFSILLNHLPGHPLSLHASVSSLSPSHSPRVIQSLLRLRIPPVQRPFANPVLSSL